MKFQLSPIVRTGMKNGKLRFGFGSIQQTFEDPQKISSILKIAASWKSPASVEDMRQRFSHLKFADWSIETLIGGHYLIPAGLPLQESRFSRDLLALAQYVDDPARALDEIQRKHVAIVGCGGIGNHVSTMLATLGVRKLTLFDGDTIELSNLTRQFMFHEADVGKSKVDVLSHRLKERNSQLEIVRIAKYIESPESFDEIDEDCDLLVVSADKPNQILHWANSYCVQQQKPFMNVGYINDIPSWGPLVVPGVTGCIECGVRKNLVQRSPHDPNIEEIRTICSSNRAPSTGPINEIASGLAVMDVVRFLANLPGIHAWNKAVGLWTNELRFETQDYSMNPSCETCGALQHQ